MKTDPLIVEYWMHGTWRWISGKARRVLGFHHAISGDVFRAIGAALLGPGSGYWVLIVAACAGLPLFGCHRAAAGADAATEDTAPKPVVAVTTIVVRPQSMSSVLDVTGSLATLPGAESKVAPAAAGRVRSVFVHNGDRVSRGQLLAELDPGPLLGQEQSAEAAVRSAEATVHQAEAGYRSIVVSNDSSVVAARTNLKAADVALQKLLAGSRPEEISRARSDVSAAEATAAHARDNYDREQRLYAAGIVAHKDLQESELDLSTARSTLHAAEDDLSLKERPNRPQDVLAAQLTVQQARDALNAAIAATSQNQVKAGDIAVAQQQLSSTRGTLAAARSQLTAQFIRAPISGTVVQRSVDPGESVDPSGSIAIIADLTRVRVVVQVPAGQAGAVHSGDLVQFSADSEPTRTYTARVSVVSPAVSPTSNAVAVEAVAENSDGRLRESGFVHARITTSRREGVLATPASAIVMIDDKPTVFVVDKTNLAHAHPVERGIRQEDLVEILAGIQAGNRIVTTGAYELDDGTSVQPDAREFEGAAPESKERPAAAHPADSD